MAISPGDPVSQALHPIAAESLTAARQKAAASHRSLTDLLEEELGEPAARFVARLGLTLEYPVLEMNALHDVQPAFELMPYADCVRRRIVVARQDQHLIAVVSDPFDLRLRAYIEARLGSVRWHLAHRDDLAAYLAMQEEILKAVDPASYVPNTAALSAKAGVEEVSLASIADDASPTVRLVNSTIYDALKIGASDIHFESVPSGLQIKYRVDGVLTPIMLVPGTEAADQAVSRLKVMAELDIAEKRIPQDGRFKLSVKGHETDFRVSVMPSSHGEDIVVRILDKRALTDQFRTLKLDLLGFDPASLAEIRKMAREPYGMLLVTGPTGSGKTTTLYAALSEINSGQDKIITIEDPVEYQLPGILQIPVNEKKGLTFARGLRSILRHDPDKILVGEIRDPETAQIAIQSALTGHLVFTSVHANNVFDVLGRFLHMGVDTYSFVSALNGIVAQRLIRLVCSHCAVDASYTPTQLSESGITPEQAAGMMLVQGRGCGHCRGTGYRGRSAIAEILRLSDETRELITERRPIRSIKEAAQRTGTRFLRQSAIDLMASGRTTLEEINRVTFVA